jgi:hypothetical protein
MSFKESTNPVIMPIVAKMLLNALSTIPTAALLVPFKVHLFNNDIQIAPTTPLASLIEPTWTGYAAISIAALTGPINLDDNHEGMTAEAIFTCTTAPTASDLIYGYFVTGTAGVVLEIAERFDAPVPIINANDFVSVQIVFPEPYARSWNG